jgi:hypothetical protein
MIPRARSYTRRERDLLAAALLSYRDVLANYIMESEPDECDADYSVKARLHIDLEVVRGLLGEFAT